MSALLRLLPLRRGRTMVLLGSGVLPAEALAGRGAMAAARPGNGATRAVVPGANGATRAVVPGANGVAVAGDLLRDGGTGTVGLVGSVAAGGKTGVDAAVEVGVRRGRGLRRAWGR